MRRFCLCALAIFLTGGSIGCGLFHELRPERLKRWNYGVNGTPSSAYTTSVSPEDGASGAYYASITDFVPVTIQPKAADVSFPTR